MSYRKRLLLTFTVVALITNGVSMTVMYKLSRHRLYEEYRAKLLSIAASVSTLLDGDQLKSIQTRSDETTSAYGVLREKLRLTRDANRRKETRIARMFTVIASKGDP